MPRRVLIFDTSILCCFLGVPGKDTTGPSNDRWDQNRAAKLVEVERVAGSTFVLPLATIIETGNHIAQARGDRFPIARKLTELIADSARGQSPWAPFSEQDTLWSQEHLEKLAKQWPELAKTGLTIGDATIKDVADYYARAGYDAHIVTADQMLKSYQPPATVPPRRRR
jgi:hypothetical protein